MHLTRTLTSLAAAVALAVLPDGVNGAEDPEIKELSDGSTVAIFRNTSAPYTWPVPPGVSEVRYLVVGGGGGGGYGGGGGGYALEDTASVQPGSVLIVSVGAGGDGGADGANGIRGCDSSLAGALEVTAKGGGYGGGVNQDGGAGGCGGGGSKNYLGGSCTQGPSGYGGTGGGTSYSGSGAGVTGRNATAKEKMTEGGAGLVSSITGAEVEYGKGGQGQTTSTPATGTAGEDGTGTGGGGSRSGAGAKGGSGVVILRYTLSSDIDLSNATVTVTPTSATHTGEEIDAPSVTVTVNDEVVDPSHYTLVWNPAVLKDVGSYDLTVTAQGAGYTGSKTVPGAFTITEKPVGDDWGYEFALGSDTVRVYTNTASAGFAWTIPSDVTSIRYLVVGGGGGGGGKSQYGGGGGAGGMKDDVLAVASGDQLVIRVGAGGAGATSESVSANGEASSISRNEAALVTVAGGGAGGCGGVGSEGACGGGGAKSQKGGKGILGYWGYKGTSGGGGAGGGGMGSGSLTGDDFYPEGEPTVGIPGEGLSSDITGVPKTYAAGGAGGSLKGPAPAAGADGTGNGGGGAGKNKTDGFKGGDGVVILRYATAQRSRGIMLIFN